jgi:hypothetical protein
MSSQLHLSDQSCCVCSEHNSYSPPCISALQHHKSMIFPLNKIGASCPFRASFRRILEMAKNPQAATEGAQTRAVLAALQKNLQAAASNPESVGIYQARTLTTEGLNHNLVYIYGKVNPDIRKASGDTGFVILRAVGSMEDFARRFRGLGLNTREGVERFRSARYAKKDAAAKETKARHSLKVKGTFARHTSINVGADKGIVDWDAIQAALESSSKSGAVTAAGGYNKLGEILKGCARLERAFDIALNLDGDLKTHFQKALRAKYLPEGGGVFEAAGELIKGFAIQVRIMGGVVALGAVAGGALGSCIATPGVGTVAGAELGAQAALWLYTQLSRGMAIKGTIDAVRNESGALQKGILTAWNGDPEAGGAEISKVVGVILAELVAGAIALAMSQGAAAIGSRFPALRRFASEEAAKRKRAQQAKPGQHAPKSTGVTAIKDPKIFRALMIQKMQKKLQKLSAASSLGFTAKEVKAFQNISKNVGLFVVRQCKEARLKWLHSRMVISKPLWMAWKSLGAEAGEFAGLVAIRKAHLQGKLVPAQVGKNTHFDLAHLGQPNLQGQRPMYKIPAEMAPSKLKSKAVLNDHFLINTKADGTGDWVIMTKGGHAYISDIDIVNVQARRRSGGFDPDRTKIAQDYRGKHEQYGGTDDLAGERKFNQMWEKEMGVENTGVYSAFQHGGGGASATYLDAKGVPKWPALNGANKQFEFPEEKLVMGVNGQVYVFDSWIKFGEYCIVHDIEFPWHTDPRFSPIKAGLGVHH